MKTFVFNPLLKTMAEHRAGAQFEISAVGEEKWTALVGNEDMPHAEAMNLAYLFTRAPAMLAEINALKKEIQQLKSDVAGRDGQIEELRSNLRDRGERNRHA